MGKRWFILFCSFLTIGLLSSFGFRKAPTVVPEHLREELPEMVTFPKPLVKKVSTLWAPPFLGTSYIGFREALGFKESGGDYSSINTLGYLGKYQFGAGTLQVVGVYNTNKFLNDPILQEKVFFTNISRNKWILRKDIEWFVGKKIRGVEITESGILAAAHLAGPGNVMKYLRSNGQMDVQDAYGTTIYKYIQHFSGYDISHVPTVRNPKIAIKRLLDTTRTIAKR